MIEDGEYYSVLYHYLLHRLKILPSQFESLPEREKIFIEQSIIYKAKQEKKEMNSMKK